MNTSALEEQLEAILNDFNKLRNTSKHSDLSDHPKHEQQALVTRMIAAVHRIAGPRSAYAQEIDRILNNLPRIHEHITSIAGIAGALLTDLKSGYIQSLIEIIHGSVFGDFLEMAQHLQDSGYKDAAAVIAGSTLESHLRELCSKAGLSTEHAKTDGSITPKKADAMNAELASQNIYSKLDQKNVMAWLDLRNKAAHGKYRDYTADQSGLMIAGIRDFLTRHPA